MAESRAAHPRTLRLGTRGSKLARWQAEWVAERAAAVGARGRARRDRDARRCRSGSSPIEEIGTRGVFTKEIQRALLAGEVDLAVHSLKDLPTEPVDGLMLAAVPQRGECGGCAGDAEQGAGSRESGAIDSRSMPRAPACRMARGWARAVCGGRRSCGIVRPDLHVADVRGNVDTRLRKLDEGQFDAIVLAEAGLRRLGLADRITQVLPFDVMLPAVGQGALGIECRADDAKTQAAVAPLDDAATRAAVTAERALLGALARRLHGAGRRVGDALRRDGLHLSAVVLSADGARRLAASDRHARRCEHWAGAWRKRCLRRGGGVDCARVSCVGRERGARTGR